MFVRTGTTWSQQAYLKASNTGAGDNFGHAIALYGNTLVVGAPGEASNATGANGNQVDNSASRAGAVYVFVRTGTTWSQQAYLKASNTGAGDNFGAAVALWGDTLAVGAPGEGSSATGVNGNQTDNSADAAGAAYVFVRTGTTWNQLAYLKASNTGASDHFGSSVAVSFGLVVVGAPGEASNATGVNGNQADNSADAAGAVYVFRRSANTWSQWAYLKAPNPEASDLFGTSVALAGSVVAVGAPGEDSAATGFNGNQADNSASLAGALYLFHTVGTAWAQEAYIKASATDAGDQFGASVALDGNMLAVGAPGEASNATGIGGNQSDNSASLAGAAHLFVRAANSGTTWSHQDYIKASNPESLDLFGSSIALSGDILAVAAVGEASNAIGVNGNQADNSASQAGAIYVFR